MGPMLAQDVQNRLLGLEGVDDVAVELVWDPPWNQGMMTEAAKLQLGLTVERLGMPITHECPARHLHDRSRSANWPPCAPTSRSSTRKSMASR